MAERLAGLSGEVLAKFRKDLLEAERQATRESRLFLEPGRGKLDVAKSNRNVIVFGRRGSGKTSLLAKARADLAAAGIASWIDVEPYKRQRYPDVLLSFLDILVGDVQAQITTRRPSAVARIFRTSVAKKYSQVEHELQSLKSFIQEHLDNADGATRQDSRSRSAEEQLVAEGQAIGIPLRMRGSETKSESEAELVQSTYDKLDAINRMQRQFHSVFRAVTELTAAPAFVFIDDLYQLPPDSQPQVVDFFQGLSKDSNLFIKIGTIRHRTTWYVHGRQPIGMKLGDDATGVDLDLTLEEFQTTRHFLLEVVQRIGTGSGVPLVNTLLTIGAIDRLVLASGGVVRDFIGLLGRAIEIAQNDEEARQVSAEHINHAAANFEENKREELKRDGGQREQLERELGLIKEFCIRERKSNVFLMDLHQSTEHTRLANELMDLRLLHKVRSSVSTKHSPGDRYTAFMLDLSHCVNDERVIRGLELVEFWQGGSEKEKIRQERLVYPQADTEKESPAPKPEPSASPSQSKLPV